MTSRLDTARAFVARWVAPVVLGGAVGGVTAVVLSACVDWCAARLAAVPLFAFALPVCGILTLLIYNSLEIPSHYGTADVVATIDGDADIPPLLAPAVIAGTSLTILGGGSVGKEAAALQAGASAALLLRHPLGLDTQGSRLLALYGMGGALGALFGAPIAAGLFVIELIDHRDDEAISALAVLGAGFVGKGCALLAGTQGLHVGLTPPAPTSGTVWPAVFLGIGAAALAIFFCLILGLRKKLDATSVPYWARLLVVGTAAVVALYLGGWQELSGTGMDQTREALMGQDRGLFFAGKLVLTSVLLAAGFKGGEIMPAMCIGATFGAFVAGSFGMAPADVGFFSALGLVAFFSAATNCPLATLALGCELFGIACCTWFAAAALVGYALTPSFSLYGNTRHPIATLLEARKARKKKLES